MTPVAGVARSWPKPRSWPRCHTTGFAPCNIARLQSPLTQLWRAAINPPPSYSVPSPDLVAAEKQFQAIPGIDTSGGRNLGGPGVGGYDQENVPPPAFASQCKAEGGVFGNPIYDRTVSRVPTSEGGWTCRTQNARCFDFLTYSGREYRGGESGCPELGLVPAALIPPTRPVPTSTPLPPVDNPTPAPAVNSPAPAPPANPALRPPASIPVPVRAAPTPDNSPTIGKISLTIAACARAEKGFITGFFNCPGSATVEIRRPVPSGLVTVFFGFTGGSAFHGQLQVGQATGTFTVPVTNDFFNICETSIPTTVLVKDGPLNGPAVLAQIPVTITQSCS